MFSYTNDDVINMTGMLQQIQLLLQSVIINHSMNVTGKAADEKILKKIAEIAAPLCSSTLNDELRTKMNKKEFDDVCEIIIDLLGKSKDRLLQLDWSAGLTNKVVQPFFIITENTFLKPVDDMSRVMNISADTEKTLPQQTRDSLTAFIQIKKLISDWIIQLKNTDGEQKLDEISARESLKTRVILTDIYNTSLYDEILEGFEECLDHQEYDHIFNEVHPYLQSVLNHLNSPCLQLSNENKLIQKRVNELILKFAADYPLAKLDTSVVKPENVKPDLNSATLKTTGRDLSELMTDRIAVFHQLKLLLNNALPEMQDSKCKTDLIAFYNKIMCEATINKLNHALESGDTGLVERTIIQSTDHVSNILAIPLSMKPKARSSLPENLFTQVTALADSFDDIMSPFNKKYPPADGTEYYRKKIKKLEKMKQMGIEPKKESGFFEKLHHANVLQLNHSAIKPKPLTATNLSASSENNETSPTPKSILKKPAKGKILPTQDTGDTPENSSRKKI